MGIETTFEELVSQHRDSLTPAEQRVAIYLQKNTHDVLFATAEKLGKDTGTSDATVVRTARKLGFSGLPELKHELGRFFVQKIHPSIRLRERIAHTGTDVDEILQYVFVDANERLDECKKLITDEDIETATQILESSAEIFSFGVGTSSLSAEYLGMRLNRLGKRAYVIRHGGFLFADELLAINDQSCVVLYIPGRVLTECKVLLQRAAEVGAPVILVTDSLMHELRDQVQVCLQATHAPGGVTNECLTAMAITDVVILFMTAKEGARAERSSKLLTEFRRQLGIPTSNKL